MNDLDSLKNVLLQSADPAYAAKVRMFFKTAEGEYAAGEQFLGIRMPVLRQLLKPFQALPLPDIFALLNSSWHEEKMSAVLILVLKYQTGTPQEQHAVYRFYAKNRHLIGNWDLVDNSAAAIVGHYHYYRRQDLPQSWIKEVSLWARRIVIVASHYYIKQDCYTETLALVPQVFNDQQDLIHKAAGWMLREVGKRNMVKLQQFLNEHHTSMPRTMLRYAIEHMSEKQRQAYLRR